MSVRLCVCLFVRFRQKLYRVVEFRRVRCGLLSKDRQWVATWRITAREWVPGLGVSRGVAWRGVAWRGDANGTTGDCLGLTVLSSMVLAVLLIIGGVVQNPGPDLDVENTVRLLCAGCGRDLKSGIQCELCGRWYHYSCGSVKVQAAERENVISVRLER
jgi:hypothetical protein